MAFKQSQYAAALEEILSRGLRDEHRAMLRAHWAAPARTVSMTQLAQAAGYPAFYHANIHYGSLARRIARYGSISVPPSYMALYAVATWTHTPYDKRGQFAFTMRPELAKALEALNLTKGAKAPAESNDALEALEGEERKMVVLHRAREQWLRDAKIREVLDATGALCCQVPGCGFDFEAVYGSTGRGYAHVHHLKPLSSRQSPSKTKLDGLAVVCANCHAMIHRFGTLRPLDGLVSL